MAKSVVAETVAEKYGIFEKDDMFLYTCQFCEDLVPVTSEGAEDEVILHLFSTHPEKAERFCTANGLNFDELVVRLLGEEEKGAEPAPKTEEAAVPTIAVCRICGYQPESGRDAAAHKKTCKPKAKPRAKPRAKSSTDPWAIFDKLSELEASSYDDAIEEAKKLKENSDTFYEKVQDVSRLLGSKKSTREEMSLYRDMPGMKTRIRKIEREIRVLVDVLNEARTTELYQLRQKLIDAEIEAKALKRAKAEEEAALRNSSLDDIQKGLEETWKEAQKARFAKLLYGEKWVRASSGKVIPFLDDITWKASSAIRDFKSGGRRVRAADIRKLTLNAVHDRMKEHGILASAVKKAANVTFWEVNGDGDLVERKSTKEFLVRQELSEYANIALEYAMFCMDAYHENGLKTIEAMRSDAFKEAFGWVLGPQPEDVEKPKYRAGKGDTAQGPAVRFDKDADLREYLLASKSNTIRVTANRIADNHPNGDPGFTGP